jgi:hypothetical protein
MYVVITTVELRDDCYLKGTARSQYYLKRDPDYLRGR